jgi:hypothetical protein
MFSKRQSEILMNLAKTKEIFTFDDLQKELQEDPEAKELLQKIRLVANGEYKKAGIDKFISNSKPTSTTNNNNKNNIEEVELYM